MQTEFSSAVKIIHEFELFISFLYWIGNDILAVLGGRLELETRPKTEVQPQPDRNSEPVHVWARTRDTARLEVIKSSHTHLLCFKKSILFWF